MRQRSPELPWALLLAAGLLGAAATGPSVDPWFVAVVVAGASFLAGRRMASLRTALWVFSLMASVGLVTAVAQSGIRAWSPMLLLVLIASVEVALPWWLGRTRRLHVEHLERERRVVADQARLRERARIAADMHDSLGHDLALMALRSGALELDLGASRQQREAATAVRVGAVAASERLREILGVLRQDGEGPAPVPPHDIDELVERAQAAGIDIRLQPGPPVGESLPTVVRQTAYRVVQEAITNASNHAPGSPVTVRIDSSRDPVLVEVSNPVTLTSPPAQGHGSGLTAMAERLRVAGGSLSAKAQDGRFLLHAEIPKAAVVHLHLLELDVDTPDTRWVQRQRHAGLLRTAAFPALLAVGILAALLGVQALTVWQTALHPDAYAAVQLGQTREQISTLLPPSSQDFPPPVIALPPAPPAARCQYFQARAHVFDLTQDMYRLCFRDEVLVSKDELLPRRG